MKKIIGLGLAVASFGAVAAEWDKITPSADFRFRNENNTLEGNSGKSKTSQKMRVRLGFDYGASEDLHFHVRLASGGSSATSTNQTLDSDSASSALNIDRAFIGHHIGDVHLHLGKMKNFYTRVGGNQLIWDGDVNLEGIHTSYSKMGAYVNLGSFSMVADSATNDNDVTLLASQLGYKGAAGTVGYNLGVSNYHYQGAHAASYQGSEGMNMLETYLGLSMDVGLPVSVHYTAVTNNEADDLNTANSMGIKVGKTKKKGDWSVGYEIRSIETNAVVASLNDGSFANAENDSQGSIISAKYKTTDKSAVKATMYNTTLNMDAGTDEKEDRFQLDFNYKF